ncbi:GRAS family protein [Selaginella moellendorffii]|uniref:GRAS family protein n=1 Tax=Selaginella moellendorffii TaxID=88036 RepID=D8S1B3_SELML|nr:scarecrow-like protein 34 [Selaginella moellendorffii]EFJ21679.1 GRAS family protein [Selaginella moellendorffii]|eukprot:XP_002977070.1 scarecrow-like protein 34 [Selaginella moellendorffii]
MSADLVSKLRAALLHHQVRLDPVPQRQHVEDPNDPTLAYISRMLLDEEEEEEEEPPQMIQLQDPYKNLIAELAALVSSPGGSGNLIHPDDCGNISVPDVHESRTGFLKSMLLEAARAVAGNRGSEVYRIISEVRSLASPGGSSEERTALFFADALIARFTGFGPQVYSAMVKGIRERHSVHVRLLNLPSFRVTQRFANGTILDFCQGATRIHIVDYGIHYGCQWPQLIQRLSQRPEGPPAMKITGIDFPRVDVKETERNLVEYAKSCGISLEFEVITSTSWELVQPKTHVNDLLIVNCNFRLRHLREDGSVGDNPRKLFFERVYSLKPDLFIQCVMDASSNLSSPFFIQRFEGALESVFTKMDLFQTLLQEDMPEEYDFIGNIMAKTIMNMVAMEGVERLERPNSYRSWDSRARRAGFEQQPVRPKAVELVKAAWCSSKPNCNFKMGMDGNWLLLGWKERVLYAMSTWRPQNKQAG